MRIPGGGSSALARALELAQRAKAAERRADQLRRQPLTVADVALEARRAANEASARAGQSKPFELADRVHDVFDADSLSAADSPRLFGTQSLVTPEEAARADAVRVGAATNASVRNGSQVLLERLQASSYPAYRVVLIRKSLPHIEEMGRQVSLDDGRPSEADLQKRLANLSRPAELAGSLDRLGRGEAAAEVAKLTREALSDLRETPTKRFRSSSWVAILRASAR